jgi:hypothetical protein
MCWVENCPTVLSLRSSRSDFGVGELKSLCEEQPSGAKEADV